MGKHVHVLSDKNFDKLTAVCAHCGPTRIKVYGNTYRCLLAYYEGRNRVYRDRKGTLKDVKSDVCARCGFVAEASCQMDLYHLDGDRTNHAPDNMQTLCANCHRLKSFVSALYSA